MNDYHKAKPIMFKYLTTVCFVAVCSSAMAAPSYCEKIDSDIAQAYESVMHYSTYAGHFSEDGEFEAATDKFYDAIGRYSMLNDGIACPLPLARKQGVRVHTSEDGNFRAISWDEYTGGTMHFYDGLIQYQDPDNKNGSTLHTLTHGVISNVLGVHTIDLPTDSSSETTKPRRVYLINYAFRGSNAYHAQSIRLYEVADDKLLYPNLIQTTTQKTDKLGFDYNAFSLYNQNRRADSLFQIDNRNKTILFPVVMNTKDFPYGEVSIRNIQYRFSNGYFRKVNQ